MEENNVQKNRAQEDRKRVYSKKIKERAQELGFDLVGFTSADPFPEAYRILKKRLDEGKLAEFVSRDLKLLTTPRLHLPTARSIISLAMSYAVDNSAITGPVKIASYTRGRDYHQIMRDRMEKLVAYLKTLKPDIETMVFTDTGPLLEREIAYRAGLGWFGKNNNLINPIYGSYLFLGEIFTDLVLEYDRPQENGCADCNLCLISCAGGAFKEPYYLDPSSCISNLTQKKGILAEEERKKIGSQLWGCDICQQVCPYNKDIPYNLHQEYLPVLNNGLEEILMFSKKELPVDWENAALSWRGVRILKRNALIIIGNNKEERYRLLIEQQILNDPSPILRAYGVWALGRIGDELSREKILKLAAVEKDRTVITEINKVLTNNNWSDE